jgi:hypothetical protein
MTIDVTIQTNGTDYREQRTTVRLPPEVHQVRYNPATSTRTAEVIGDRRKLARTLREAGYVVEWDDPNPAVALGSRTSPARAVASAANGALSKGRPPSTALLCPEPLLTALLRLDKGTLADLLFMLADGDGDEVRVAMRDTVAARQRLQPDEVTS